MPERTLNIELDITRMMMSAGAVRSPGVDGAQDMSSDNRFGTRGLVDLSPDDFQRYQACLQKTLAVYRRAQRKGRPISTMNAQRLFARLWQAEGADRSVANVGRAMVSERLRLCQKA